MLERGGGGVLCTGQVKKGVTYLPVLDINGMKT